MFSFASESAFNTLPNKLRISSYTLKNLSCTPFSKCFSGVYKVKHKQVYVKDILVKNIMGGESKEMQMTNLHKGFKHVGMARLANVLIVSNNYLENCYYLSFVLST